MLKNLLDVAVSPLKIYSVELSFILISIGVILAVVVAVVFIVAKRKKEKDVKTNNKKIAKDKADVEENNDKG